MVSDGVLIFSAKRLFKFFASSQAPVLKDEVHFHVHYD